MNFVISGTHLENAVASRANRSRICFLLCSDSGYPVHGNVVPSFRHIGPYTRQHRSRLVLLQEGTVLPIVIHRWFIRVLAKNC